jgi:hypothetical protein
VRFATPGYPLKSLRERGTSPKDLQRKVIPIPSRFPIGNMAVRQDEECRGTPSVVLVARVGIGIGGRSIIKLSVKAVGWLEPIGFADMVAARCR